MASIGAMIVERVEWDTRSNNLLPLSLLGWVRQQGTATSAGSGFDAYGPPLASRAGSDSCHLDVREVAPRST
jgi:hypothetical protein